MEDPNIIMYSIVKNETDPLIDVEEFEFYIRFNGNEYIMSNEKHRVEDFTYYRTKNPENGYYIYAGTNVNINIIIKIQDPDVIMYSIVK